MGGWVVLLLKEGGFVCDLGGGFCGLGLWNFGGNLFFEFLLCVEGGGD